MSRFALALGLGGVLLGACQPDAIVVHPDSTPTDPVVTQPVGPIAPVITSYTSGLQYNGAIGVAHSAMGGTGTPVIEISAPILPRLEYTYVYVGDKYPKTAADEQDMVEKASLVYEVLLDSCSAKYPGITLTSDMGPPLTHEQVQANYQAVASCAYKDYSSKPYWIPSMIDDVKICELVIGADWHLLSQSDLAGFTDSDYQFFADTLQLNSDFYFSLNVYVRGSDGRLKLGTLTPGAAMNLIDISDADLSAKQTWVPQASAGYVPRCIRRMVVP